MLNMKNVLKRQLIEEFCPFWFVMVMGTGISADILHSFPYEAYWLRICSYIMFALACLLFISLLVVCIANVIFVTRTESWSVYFRRYFLDVTQNVFWGTSSMGMVTIINFISQLCLRELTGTVSANRLIITVYVLWWVNVALSLGTAWGVTFIIWKSFHLDGSTPNENIQTKFMRENLQSVLLLPVVPLVVVCSSGSIFTMTDLFCKNMNRNIQLVTLFVTMLMWLHALLLVIFITAVYVWNLYVNKIPKINAIFTMFLVVGPLGQGSFGILLLSDDVKKYIEKYYPIVSSSDLDFRIVSLAVAWAFKVFGIVMSLLLISSGIFFTIISFASILSYLKSRNSTTKVYQFHKGWWAMTFPLGTMALGTNEFYKQYNPYFPIGAFRVLSTIYSVLCIGSTITCLTGSLCLYSAAFKNTLLRERDRSRSDLSSVFCKASH